MEKIRTYVEELRRESTTLEQQIQDQESQIKGLKNRIATNNQRASIVQSIHNACFTAVFKGSHQGELLMRVDGIDNQNILEATGKMLGYVFNRLGIENVRIHRLNNYLSDASAAEKERLMKLVTTENLIVQFDV